MTATTAPVKSFDSLRDGAVEVRVTRNRNRIAAHTQAMMMRMLLITVRWSARAGLGSLHRLPILGKHLLALSKLRAQREQRTNEIHRGQVRDGTGGLRLL